jgi:hypothetical protein
MIKQKAWPHISMNAVIKRLSNISVNVMLKSLATDFSECCKECCNAIISMNIIMQCFATDIQE